MIDKVPANWKPRHEDGTPDNEKGIKVQGGGGGATLVVDASGRDALGNPTHPNDTLFQVKDSDHIEVTDRSGADFVDGFSYFGPGVSHLVIKTNNVAASGPRLPGQPDDPNNPDDEFNFDG